MFIFIEVTADATDANPSDFLYTDQILFGNDPNFQKVELVTLIQDAYLIYPQRTQNPDESFTYESLNLGLDENGNPITIRGQFLDELDPINGNELHWTNIKPYVIYGYAAVPSNKTLIVDPGARIHFHAESGLIVANDASIHVNGVPSSTSALENEVIFEGDRLETSFSEIPGQWGTIWLTQGSTNNQISNLTIKNATVGILVSGNDGSSNPTLDIRNTQIYNCSNVGILARTGNIEGRNVVINNCGQASFAGTFGGSYEFTHSTFANYWPTSNQTSVVLSNENLNPTNETALTKANFRNCILYSPNNYSFNLQKEGTIFNYNFDHCLIKFADFNNQFNNNALYDFSNSSLFNNCLIATNSTINNPDFKDARNNKLIIGENSAAKGTANTIYSNFNDILNKNRNGLTDIGAYNYTTFN